MKFVDGRSPNIMYTGPIALAVCLLPSLAAVQAEEPLASAGLSDDDWTIVIQPRPLAKVEVDDLGLPVPPLPAQVDGDQLVSTSAFTPALLANQPDTLPEAPEAGKVPDEFHQEVEEKVVMHDAGKRMSYREAYDSIPFSRSEYNANPSYRHEAAMELMFGQLRPMTTVKYVPVSLTTQPAYVTPYRYRRNGYGVNYNFYYPRPTVYRAY